MKKILLIGSMPERSEEANGETIKNRLLNEYLAEQSDIKLKVVDTGLYRKHFISISMKILFKISWCDVVVISCATRGSYRMLTFLRKIRFKKPIYYFVIGGSLAKYINKYNWKLDLYENIKKIYVETTDLKNKLVALGLKNVEILPNFRRIKKFKNQWTPSNAMRFVYYGRVIGDKGVPEAIRLIKQLRDRSYNCTLDIYGKLDKKYPRFLDEAKYEAIKYHGEIIPDGKKEYQILSAYDVMLFPTRYYTEGLPGAIIDAEVAGLAVIASKWAYANECLEENKNAILFEFDNYDDFYQKTEKFIQSGKLVEFKKKSEKMALKYDIEKCLSNFMKELII